MVKVCLKDTYSLTWGTNVYTQESVVELELETWFLAPMRVGVNTVLFSDTSQHFDFCICWR